MPPRLVSGGAALLGGGVAMGLAASWAWARARGGGGDDLGYGYGYGYGWRAPTRVARKPGDFARAAMGSGGGAGDGSEGLGPKRAAEVTRTRVVGGVRTVTIRMAENKAAGMERTTLGAFPLSHVVLEGVSFAVDEAYAFGKRCRGAFMPTREFADGSFEVSLRDPAVASASSTNPAQAPTTTTTTTTTTTPGREEDDPTLAATRAFLASLQPGAALEVAGPHATVTGAVVREALGTRQHVCVVAGGTGVTAFLQLVDQDDGTAGRSFTLVWSTRGEEDGAFCARQLDRLESRDPSRFAVHRTLTRRVPRGWMQGSGRLTADKLRATLPPPSSDVLVVVCGPDSFVRAVAGGAPSSAALSAVTGRRGGAAPFARLLKPSSSSSESPSTTSAAASMTTMGTNDASSGGPGEGEVRGIDRWTGPVGGMLGELGFKADQVARL